MYTPLSNHPPSNTTSLLHLLPFNHNFSVPYPTAVLIAQTSLIRFIFSPPFLCSSLLTSSSLHTSLPFTSFLYCSLLQCSRAELGAARGTWESSPLSARMHWQGCVLSHCTVCLNTVYTGSVCLKLKLLLIHMWNSCFHIIHILFHSGREIFQQIRILCGSV